ncbi:MAG: glycosyltransferase family 4 protein [Dysgonamonadaceae bacterium]|jgi:glycosyltransferase involved in cell wall biosynthesis|nr:glycosyltransferase family 4 protein [Dysgonamonadaceae bacterium]
MDETTDIKKKKLLVDLSALKDVYCGLGQVALNYGRHFMENAKTIYADYQVVLLVPKDFFGKFGNEVEYISSSSWLRKHCRFLFPKVDVWHAVHQLCRFKPAYKQTKFLLTIHDLNYLYEKSGYELTKRQRRIKRKIQRADKIICISEFAKSEVEKHHDLTGKDYSVILNGVDNLEQQLAQKPKTTIKQPFFFSIGVIKQKKNFHVLLDLMKIIPEKHLYLAGKNNTKYGDAIVQRIENDNITNVHLLGTISQEEKVWLLKNCEAFLFPSLFEGFGLPVIEAMQFGKPVFSSDKTSLKEIGGKFAYFWENFEPNDMKKMIDDNLDNHLKNEELQEKEKEYAVSFSYEKHFEEYEKIYRELSR